MPKVNSKQQEIMNQLTSMIMKQASAGKATGIPGKDVTSESVSASTEHVNQNAVKPENNGPQAHSQKPSTDPSKPVATAKKAEEEATETAKAAEATEVNSSVEKLGKELLTMVEKLANPVATGIPGKDVKSESVSTDTEHVDQNAVKPENNGPQAHNQKPSTDPSKPVATAKKAEDEEAEKKASYELGKLWAEMVIKQAQDQELEMYKEAGRHDFEALVQKAAQDLKVQQVQQVQQAQQTKQAAYNQAVLEKQAEAAGAEAFNQIYKQAQYEYTIQQTAEEYQKLAAYANALKAEKEASLKEAQEKLAEKTAALAKVENDQREQEKFASWANAITTATTNQIMERLRSEMITPR